MSNSERNSTHGMCGAWHRLESLASDPHWDTGEAPRNLSGDRFRRRSSRLEEQLRSALNLEQHTSNKNMMSGSYDMACHCIL